MHGASFNAMLDAEADQLCQAQKYEPTGITYSDKRLLIWQHLKSELSRRRYD